MQINALNTLIAAQQARQSSTLPRTAALKAEPAPNALPEKEFLPLPFEAKPAADTPPPSSAPPGSQIDIRV